MISYRVSSPVLVIGWVRPEKFRRTLEAVRNVKPQQLFIALDGPRSRNDLELIKEHVRLVREIVDWPCEVSVKRRQKNHGLRLGVEAAISWFFREVDEGIVLEDDCVPNQDFFRFCDALLAKYREDRRVFQIAGDNSVGLHPNDESSYGFVSYPHIWGWATWRRAWQLYDSDMLWWRTARKSGSRPNPFVNRKYAQVWSSRFDDLAATGSPDTWDWRWAATLVKHGGLSVQPFVNLVSNEGFGIGATNTKAVSYRASSTTARIWPLRHPNHVSRNETADRTLARLQHRDLVRKNWKITRRFNSLYRFTLRVGRQLTTDG